MSKEMVNPRNAYGEALVELGKKHKDLDEALSKKIISIMTLQNEWEKKQRKQKSIETSADLVYIAWILLKVLLKGLK